MPRPSVLRYATMQIDASKLGDFAARYAEAWCSKDPARVAGFFSVEGSLSVNSGAAAVGRNAISEVARSFMTALPDMRVTLDKLVEQRSCVEFHWTLTGTNTGPGGTGKSVRISGFERWQIAPDGLIASSQGHFDASEYGRQLRYGVT